MSDQSFVSRCRLRDWGIAPGTLSPGPRNALVDVPDIRVGHMTLVDGATICTGATTILPHGGNLYQDKVPAALVVGNGYGKLMGGTQIDELGEIESPIVLTNTMSIAQGAEAIFDWTLRQPGNDAVRSVNPVVGETNDWRLNDIRARALTAAHILQAIEAANTGDCTEGCVGAGTGTVAFGWKGGIGQSSRRLQTPFGEFTVGVLVQTNFGDRLQFLGAPVSLALQRRADPGTPEPPAAGGSIMIVVATDLPLSDRKLARLARRALVGLARTGTDMDHGSGDYVIAFSTHPDVRRTSARQRTIHAYPDLPHAALDLPFRAVADATEEAILNSLLMATTTHSCGRVIEALPLADVREILGRYGILPG